MDYSKISVRNFSRCLECGDKISYGRTDKKFCCDECKNRHHNKKVRSSRNMKRKISSILEKNYEILNALFNSGNYAIEMSEVMLMGFNPCYFTSFKKSGRHDVYGCFDMNYIKTPGRLSSISKIQNLSLTLQVGLKEDQMKNI